jgi:tetratricopeptide (TPR) repeat protein
MDTQRIESPLDEQENQVSKEEALTELERVLSDPEFQCSERNKKFLRFVTEEYFAGRENRLKAYSIAVDVFGRPSTFDATIDPIVRIEATRLRTALQRYYEADRHRKGVQIRLARGHYVPEFYRSPNIASDDGAAGTAGRLRVPRSLRELSRRWTPVGIGLACGAAAGALLAVFWMPGMNLGPRITERPAVLLELLPGEGSDEEAVAMRDKLMIALSGFHSLRLSAPEFHTASTSNTSQGDEHSNYHVLLKYTSAPRSTAVWWQVVDRRTGEALQSGEEEIALNDAHVGDPDEALVSRLAVRFGSLRGVINTIETARDLEEPSLGNGCILRAGLSLAARSDASLQVGRRCLERTLKLRPYDADAHALLALVLLALDPIDEPSSLTAVATTHAEEAVRLAPDSDRSYAAQMAAAFHGGQLEAAAIAGRRAITLNPYNTGATARLARVLAGMGQWNEAVVLATRATQVDGIRQIEAERVLAMDAYRRGAFDEAVLRLRQMSDEDCYLSQLFLAASLGKSGQRQEAEGVVMRIREERPEFEGDVDTYIGRRLQPVMITGLKDGLQRAGTSVQ